MEARLLDCEAEVADAEGRYLDAALARLRALRVDRSRRAVRALAAALLKPLRHKTRRPC
jgi:hypothetical protein